MIARRSLLVAAALFLPAGWGQAPRPDFTYTLHASRQHHGAYTLNASERSGMDPLALAPDGSLLELIPQSTGRWVLKRLTGWESSAPREDTLWIETGHRDEEDVRFDADLRVNPDATYAIARIWATSGNTRRSDIGLDNLVVVIDLRTFKQYSRSVTADKLLTSRWWEMSRNGTVLARWELDNASSGSTWEFVALKIPSLEPMAQCRYQERYDEVAKTRVVDQDANTRCEAVLKAADRPSIKSSGKRGRAWESLAKRLRPAEHCSLTDVSADDRYALFDCSTDEMTIWDTVKTTSRAVKAVDVQDSNLVFDHPLPPSPDIALGLAKSQGRNWLLTLREAVKLEGYKLP